MVSAVNAVVRALAPATLTSMCRCRCERVVKGSRSQVERAVAKGSRFLVHFPRCVAHQMAPHPPGKDRYTCSCGGPPITFYNKFSNISDTFDSNYDIYAEAMTNCRNPLKCLHLRHNFCIFPCIIYQDFLFFTNIFSAYSHRLYGAMELITTPHLRSRLCPFFHLHPL